MEKDSQKNITKVQAEKLLENKTTDLIKGFKSKKGNTFDAYLTLKDDFTTEFKFKN